LYTCIKNDESLLSLNGSQNDTFVQSPVDSTLVNDTLSGAAQIVLDEMIGPDIINKVIIQELNPAQTP